jgi:hypothetical protein
MPDKYSMGIIEFSGISVKEKMEEMIHEPTECVTGNVV